MQKILFILTSVIALTACKHKEKSSLSFLSDYEVLELVDSVMDNSDVFPGVWNFSEWDSTSTIKRYNFNLIDTIQNEKVYVVDGFAGCSFGCSASLVIITSDDNLLQLAYQTAIEPQFIDFDNDGLMECQTFNMISWMGAFWEENEIVNLGNPKSLYYRKNYTPMSFNISKSEDWRHSDTILHETKITLVDVNSDGIEEVIESTKLMVLQNSDTLKSAIVDTIMLNKQP